MVIEIIDDDCVDSAQVEWSKNEKPSVACSDDHQDWTGKWRLPYYGFRRVMGPSHKRAGGWLGRPMAHDPWCYKGESRSRSSPSSERYSRARDIESTEPKSKHGVHRHSSRRWKAIRSERRQRGHPFDPKCIGRRQRGHALWPVNRQSTVLEECKVRYKMSQLCTWILTLLFNRDDITVNVIFFGEDNTTIQNLWSPRRVVACGNQRACDSVSVNHAEELIPLCHKDRVNRQFLLLWSTSMERRLFTLAKARKNAAWTHKEQRLSQQPG